LGWPSEAKNIADAAAAYDQLRARGVAYMSFATEDVRFQIHSGHVVLERLMSALCQ
jgi:hypothetical protein